MEEAQKRTLDGDPQSEPPAKREKIEKNQENITNTEEDTQNNTKRLPRPSKKDKNGRSAGRRRGTRPEGESQQGEGDNKEKKPRLAKRSCALMIGFSGTGYCGMQVQTSVKTIEGTLFEGLVKAGAVSEDNADDPVKVALQRAARTDAGVHAAGNVVSMRLITSIPGVEDLVSHINRFLPDEIRLWNYVRTPNSFNARTNCDSRKYTYFMPSYLLIPPKPGSNLEQSLKSVNPPDFDVCGSHPFWQEIANKPPTAHEEDLVRKRTYHATPEEMSNFREVVAKYEGSHNFHNFTVGTEYGDRSSRRFMKKIEVQDPVVYGDTEWISIGIHGQSFMLHQIRKMVCAAIMTCRTRTLPAIINEMFGPQRLIVPRAPALGLLLEHPVFEKYNQKMETEVNPSIKPDSPDRENQLRPPIDFELHRDKVEEFKKQFIYENMRKQESNLGVFDGWVRSIDAYGGPDLRYYNSKGAILDVCVVKTGTQRTQGFKEKKRFDAANFAGEGSVAPPEDAVVEEEADEEVITDKKLLAEMEG